MHTSIWEKETFYAPTDVTIIGSGFAGLWSAYFLKKNNPRLSVTIIERGIIPEGASTRNAGFATFGSLTELMHDAREMGEDNMLLMVKMRYQGLERIRKTFKKKETDFQLTGGYELITPHHPVSVKRLNEDIKWLNNKLSRKLNEKKIFELADQKINRFGLSKVNHLVENKMEGCLHPGKLCQSLLRTVQSMGITTLNQTNVTGYEKTTNGIRIHNHQGLDLLTGKLLICTNAFVKPLLPQLNVQSARGQILLTAPIEGLKIKGAFHSDEGFFYFRNLGNRLLLGGARNKAFEEETTENMGISSTIQNELELFLKRHLLPDTNYTITDRWSGIMGIGDVKMPIVKKIEDQVYCAVRMSGIGVALAPVIGEQVAEMMMK
ncbi:MAG: FAD-dependent oxidoreductase [Flavitalea sp.]